MFRIALTKSVKFLEAGRRKETYTEESMQIINLKSKKEKKIQTSLNSAFQNYFLFAFGLR